MKSLNILLILFTFIFSSLSWSKPFPGHVFYEVKYSKDYTEGEQPREFWVDFYVQKNKKAVVVSLSLRGSDRRELVYLFDDEKDLITTMDLKDKTYTEVKYNKMPVVKISEQKPQKPSEPMTVLGEKLVAKYYKNDVTKWTYSAWYSDYVTTPFKMYRVDMERMVESGAGHLALVMTREVAPGINAIYVAKKIDDKIAEHIFQVPKDFKKKN